MSTNFICIDFKMVGFLLVLQGDDMNLSCFFAYGTTELDPNIGRKRMAC